MTQRGVPIASQPLQQTCTPATNHRGCPGCSVTVRFDACSPLVVVAVLVSTTPLPSTTVAPIAEFKFRFGSAMVRHASPPGTLSTRPADSNRVASS